MKLKEYQERTLKEVKLFLGQLALWKKRAEANPELEIDFPVKAKTSLVEAMKIKEQLTAAGAQVQLR